MSLIVRKTTTTFPLSDVSLMNMTLSELYAEAVAIKRANCSEWTDETPADFGNVLLWTFTVLIQWLKQSMEQEKNNCFIETVNDREALRKICAMLQYTLSEATASSVEITFTCDAGHPGFIIDKGTQISTTGVADAPVVIFEVSQNTAIGAGITSKIITCIQGITISDEVIGSSDGTTNQKFGIAIKPVVWESETVEVYDGASWVLWSRVTDFISSDATSKQYSVTVDVNGNYSIVFGDGVNGMIPIRGTNNIRVSYRNGGGTDGNIAASLIDKLVAPITYVESVTNATAATGGSVQETISHAQRYAPASVRTQERIVTVEDIQNLCNAYVSSVYGSVAKSKAYSLGGLAIHVMLVPAAGGTPSTGLKNELDSYLSARRMVCTSITVENPSYVDVDITADVYAQDNFSSEVVASNVRQALISLVSANYQNSDTETYPHEFGRDIYLSDVYAAIDGAVGVNYCTLNAPAANVSIEDYQIADIGDITLTVYVGTGSTSFFFGKGN